MWGSGFCTVPRALSRGSTAAMTRTPSLPPRRGVCPLCRRLELCLLPASAPLPRPLCSRGAATPSYLRVIDLSGFAPYGRRASAAVRMFMCRSESVCQIPRRFLLACGWDFTDVVDESGVNPISL